MITTMTRARALLVAVALLFAPLTLAVGAQEVPGWSKELAEHFEGISLSAAQKAKIVAIQKDMHAKMDAAKKGGGEHAKHQVQQLMEQEHAAFKQELTAEQYARFEANMKAHHEAEAKAKAPAAKAGMEGMDHSKMDHSKMDHSKMEHGKDAPAKAEGAKKEMDCCKKMGDKKADTTKAPAKP